MNLLSETEKVNCLVQEIANTAPSGWKKLVFYQEVVAKHDQEPRNKSTAKCWVGDGLEEYGRSFEIGGSMEAFEAVEDLLESAKRNGEVWSGLLLRLQNDGKFNIKYYYEGTPLLDGNSDLLNERLAN